QRGQHVRGDAEHDQRRQQRPRRRGERTRLRIEAEQRQNEPDAEALEDLALPAIREPERRQAVGAEQREGREREERQDRSLDENADAAQRDERKGTTARRARELARTQEPLLKHARAAGERRRRV